jgi:hypothetical protein
MSTFGSVLALMLVLYLVWYFFKPVKSEVAIVTSTTDSLPKKQRAHKTVPIVGALVLIGVMLVLWDKWNVAEEYHKLAQNSASIDLLKKNILWALYGIGVILAYVYLVRTRAFWVQVVYGFTVVAAGMYVGAPEVLTSIMGSVPTLNHTTVIKGVAGFLKQEAILPFAVALGAGLFAYMVNGRLVRLAVYAGLAAFIFAFVWTHPEVRQVLVTEFGIPDPFAVQGGDKLLWILGGVAGIGLAMRGALIELILFVIVLSLLWVFGYGGYLWIPTLLGLFYMLTERW